MVVVVVVMIVTKMVMMIVTKMMVMMSVSMIQGAHITSEARQCMNNVPVLARSLSVRSGI